MKVASCGALSVFAVVGKVIFRGLVGSSYATLVSGYARLAVIFGADATVSSLPSMFFVKFFCAKRDGANVAGFGRVYRRGRTHLPRGRTVLD